MKFNVETTVLESYADELGFSIDEQEAMDRGHYEANKALTNNFANPYQAMVDVYVRQQTAEVNAHD